MFRGEIRLDRLQRLGKGARRYNQEQVAAKGDGGCQIGGDR